jgi:hypothetical protein
MQRVTKKQRIGLTISVVWMLIIFAFICDKHSLLMADFTIFGILPVLIGWAVWWIRRADTTHSEEKCCKEQPEEICNTVINGQLTKTSEEQAQWLLLALLLVILIAIVTVRLA